MALDHRLSNHWRVSPRPTFALIEQIHSPQAKSALVPWPDCKLERRLVGQDNGHSCFGGDGENAGDIRLSGGLRYIGGFL